TVLVSSHVLAEVAQTVDDVVIIARGRLVRAAPLDEVTAAAAGGVRVRTSESARLADRLALLPVTVSRTVTTDCWSPGATRRPWAGSPPRTGFRCSS
ncbi:MAG: hypothetical protein ACM3ZF_11295, partial [Mycobacterium leprae]